MTEVLLTLWLGFKIACITATVGMIFTFAVAAVCKWMKWAPVDITINVYDKDDTAV